jgi:hypothetical protein
MDIRGISVPAKKMRRMRSNKKSTIDQGSIIELKVKSL